MAFKRNGRSVKIHYRRLACGTPKHAGERG